ncbi:hypothetical protein AB1Y20_004153 [Prymnesium parvum]|uniref:Sulfatase N-terminal domain-containing protein n=1 Tax=Prymnesium parvum TaxID=97485 RepID=A0AB34J6X5_PRYPA
MARPHVVLIVADDIPRNMLSTFGAQHNLSSHVDSLGAHGAAFTSAYTTAPLCTPSRFSLLTGRYAANASSITAHRPWNMVGFNAFLTAREPTVAHRLRAAGYATGFVGKYHLGFPLPEAQRRGRAAFGGGGRGLSYGEMARAVEAYGGFESVRAVWGGNKQTAQSPHHPEWMAAEAVEFMRGAVAAAGGGRPFFLYFAPTVPHSPFVLPASLTVEVTRTPAGQVPYVASWKANREAVLARLTAHGLVCKDYRQCHRLAYAGAEGAKTSLAYQRPLAVNEPWLDADWLYTEPNFEQARLARLFVAGLAWLDTSVGTVLQAIDELRITPNTLVIYTADHGASFLGKGHVYEAGIRVPLLMRWPRVIPPGVRPAAPVALLDLAPTLLDAAAVPPAAADDLHGRSLLPLLASHTPPAERPLFVEIGYGRAVVRGEWKLLVVNDGTDRCKEAADGTCRNLHDEEIDRWQCNFTANGHMGNRLKGKCNMTYDAVARHPAFCDRRQLYNLKEDPLEQRNVVQQHPELYDELLALIVAHVRRVEQSNPAIAGKLGTLQQCNRRRRRVAKYRKLRL